jgi:hypothetical protein
MQELTPEGQRIVNDLAQRHGFSQEAVSHLLIAVLNGNGSMAQFNHWEFGGSGQWMRGGMLMLGDMFNSNLKGRVDSLCNEISNLLQNQPGLLKTGSFQSQSQSGVHSQTQSNGTLGGNSGLFVADPQANWWPQELGSPNASGSQNNMRYAYFANPRRLAVDAGGQVWVYDTLDHQIGGFSQQQGNNNSITFSSQFGTVNLSSLPIVSKNGVPTPPPPPSAPSNSPPAEAADIYAAISRLAELRTQGVLTESEFSAKKAELLARI